MKIENVKVCGINESIIASGYPKKALIEPEKENKEPTADDYKRAIGLGRARIGSAHDCFLKGIIVQADIEAPQYWWLQFGRYHFADIISSQSKMHKITEMNINMQCNPYVSYTVIDCLTKLVKKYNENTDGDKREELFRKIISNVPMGLRLTARITTNYLQLKTIYAQRRFHRLEEWKTFCDWIEELPETKQLIGWETIA